VEVARAEPAPAVNPLVVGLVTAALLVGLVVAAFAPGLGNEFLTWDDEVNFVKNPGYRGLGWSQLRWDWTSFQIGVYQPLAWMILGAEYLAFGLDPWGYHLTSLILYAVDIVVLYGLTVYWLMCCRRGEDQERSDPTAVLLGAGLAVGLFAVHPLRTEVVAWVSCQPYLPCALFFMLSVLAYLQAFRAGPTPAPRWGWLAGSFLLFAAALLSKAVAVSLPAVLLILDVYPLRRLGGGRGRWAGRSVWRVWWEKVPFAGLSLLFMGLAVKGRKEAEHLASLEAVGLPARIAQSCYGIWFYLVKTVVPSNLTAFYPLPEELNGVTPVFLLGILATLGMTLAAILLRRRWPGLLAAWLIYLVILAPNLGLVRIGNQIAADRYSFISMMGAVVLAAAGVAARLRPVRSGWSGPVVLGVTAASLAALVGLVVLTRAQCRIWRTTETLWSHVLGHGGSQSAIAHCGLGSYLLNQGRINEAMPHLDEALRLAPYDVSQHISIGAAFFNQGRVEEAMSHYETALRLKPDSHRLHFNLGVALARQGRPDEARAEYLEAIRLNPDDAEARNNLAAILLDQGKSSEALSQLTEALRIDPARVEAYNNLGNVFLRQGRFREAMDRYTEALRLNPRHVGVHNNVGRVLSARGQLEQAIGHFTESLRLEPNQVAIHRELGSALTRLGRIEDALAEYAAALRLDPNDAGVLNNRAMIWSSHPQARYRDGPRAVASATRACELTGWKEPGVLDTCAAAHAEAGDFTQAVKWETRAIDLLDDGSRKDAFRARLKLYQAGQPYREPAQAP
jgi:tetratricopeptide (TPR) repeat protein